MSQWGGEPGGENGGMVCYIINDITHFPVANFCVLPGLFSRKVRDSYFTITDALRWKSERLPGSGLGFTTLGFGLFSRGWW